MREKVVEVREKIVQAADRVGEDSKKEKREGRVGGWSVLSETRNRAVRDGGE